MVVNSSTAGQKLISLSTLSASPELESDLCGKKPRSLDSADLVPEPGDKVRTISTFRNRSGSARQIFCKQMSVWKAGDLKDYGSASAGLEMEYVGCRIADAFLSLWRHN